MIVASVAVYLLCASFPWLNAGTKTIGLLAFSPLEWTSDRLAMRASRLLIWVRSVKDLEAENARLRLLNQKLCLDLQQLQESAVENKSLRSLLGCKMEAPLKTLPARVIGRDLSLWFRSVEVDRGTRDGVRLFAPALVSEGLVGVVTQVSPFSSRVRLLLDPGMRVGVLFQGSRAEGILEGRLQDGCEVKYVAKDSGAKAGDVLVSSGLGGIYPKGIPVGTVLRIESHEELFLRANVSPCVDFSHLEQVLLVLGPQEALAPAGVDTPDGEQDGL